MNAVYAKPVDCIDIIPSLAEVNEHSAKLEAALYQSLHDASRIFESDIFAPVNYFAPAGEDYETRTFYHNGSRIIRLAPYTHIRFIKDSDNKYINADEFRLVTSDIYQPTGFYLKWLYPNTCGTWWNYSQISVSARWGFKCIPPDVTIAVKNMGRLMFLVNPLNRIGQNDGLSENQETRLRSTYNRIMNSWQSKFYHGNNLGIG